MSEEAKKLVSGMIDKARKAMDQIADYSQQEIDELCNKVAAAAANEEDAQEIAELAVEETKMGVVDHKRVKITKKVKGTWNDIKDLKSMGKIEEDKEQGIIKFAKPVGVISGIVPVTNCEATPPVKALFALKGKNAIVFSPHPRSKKTSTKIVNLMRDVLEEAGAPKDLFQIIEEPSIEATNELMSQSDLVVATGGGSMVKAAYSSGTPAYGVGPGNAPIIVDETADLEDAAEKIMNGKTFDNGTSCSTENSLIVEESVYDELMENLQKQGGYFTNREEKQKLQDAFFVDGYHLNIDLICRSAKTIADAAAIDISDDIKFFIVEEDGVGKEYPYSGEKLSLILTVYKYSGFDNALKRVEEILRFQGLGHSCGIHSVDDEHIEKLGAFAPVSRIMVRQSQSYGNSGNWNNGMPFTLSLGCGTWGGNITTENITLKHFLNVTWLSKPIEADIPSDKELFGEEA
ncbi:sulfoacetaldehyde dehydrogenase [Halanaerobium saccharolyticum]|uniref:Sulfoacetaldehyde dehydrogenase n=1 Tax=Halanaerobium saccharolyticum TaxID=43595 RepID=A0A4R7YRY7_9FIRM|nr:aldehyde dehydrogenase family protein [Halanaerobium saccharolyticum]RAK04045.1 sulfoacetaldehyde dehydrogenase [Halanaerobium saccharolyticum]TDV97603.1 sulfoacetaldehyde dehydrogenase [Halanaerobium saccharolyticum]TDX49229.1 sulfoacetaldehyde dehydrogenase [Halanaerobium saccharolyticum]